MKTQIYKSSFLALAIAAAALTGCVNDDDYSVPVNSLACTEPSYTVNMTPQMVPASTVVAAYEDSPANGADVIEAYVTSSDEGGNFFKSISFQTLNGSFGFSVPVDANSTFINFEPGRKVYITLAGSYTDIYNGSLRIGAIYVNPSNGSAQVGRVPDTQITNLLHRSCTVVDEEQLVRHMTLTQAKNDANLNTLIEIDNVQFADNAITTNYYDSALDLGGATNHNLVDADGNTIIFRTSSFANFAGSPVASGNGSVRGVLTKFGSDYQFMARTEDDVKLNNPRLVPAFFETFSATTWPNWVKYSVTGTQTWQLDTANGDPAPSAKMSGYQNGNFANEDWLISPAIDLTGKTSATLSFRNTSRFAGDLIKVYISTNYTTGAPSTATWTDITSMVNLDLTEEGYVFVSSGSVMVNELAGSNNARVAFKYTSTTAAARTWEIDNVKVVAQ